MNRKRALPYISHYLDDCLAIREARDMPSNARLIGWQGGFEPMFVAVWSYLGIELDEDEAEEIATDYLNEIHWFNGEPAPADYLI